MRDAKFGKKHRIGDLWIKLLVSSVMRGIKVCI